MKKAKILSLLVAFAVALPMMGTSSSALAWHKHHRYYGHYRHYGHHRHHHYRGCYYRTDGALAHTVLRRLRSDPSTYDLPIHVTARGHRVILCGTAGTAMQKQVALC